MKTLTIFYDAKCGLCGQFRSWMQAQESAVRLEFLAYDSAEATARLPELAAMQPDREIVIMNERGEIWQGAAAWVTCLWALPKWRPWARRLASPALLPIAGQACRLISQNRLSLSRLLVLHSDAEFIRDCEEVPDNCPDGTCRIGRGLHMGGARH